jgi:DNA ligase D-like protein (predicted 3'-phosphoesterase)
MSKRDALKTYRDKRDFDKTPEPSGKGGKRGGKGPIFVIQQHDASRLHYDFRLEIDGVLASWAIPKGPSTDPREKRLAVRTEDHPLEYADFEGIIPKDEYGGGTVIVWDAGWYRNLKQGDGGEEVPMGDALESGHLTVWLEGKKIRGGYSLKKFRGREKEQWLLVKMKDEAADARRKPTTSEPWSVLTKRTVKEVAREEHGQER